MATDAFTSTMAAVAAPKATLTVPGGFSIAGTQRGFYLRANPAGITFNKPGVLSPVLLSPADARDLATNILELTG